MAHPPRRLNPRQQRFVDEYLVLGNAAEAARRAGYSLNSAQQIGANLMRKPHIDDAIREAMAAAMKRNDISLDRVLEEMARIAFANPLEVARWGPDGVEVLPSAGVSAGTGAAIAEVTHSTTRRGAQVRVRFFDKMAALNGLARYFQLFGAHAEKIAHPNSYWRDREAAKARLRKVRRQLAEAAAGGEPPRGVA